MKDFFKLISVAEFVAHVGNFPILDPERIGLEQALGRVLAEDVLSSESLPPFARSTVDGYAVRAADTFGCSESELALLQVVDEIPMGASAAAIRLRPGQVARIWTGGELPPKADAAVMVEYTQNLDDTTIGVFRPVAPGENCIRAGEDFEAGKSVLRAGHCIRPQDIGVLAGLGISEVAVYRRPRVAILATGDELVPYTEPLQPGQIRDMNAVMMAAMVRQAGGEPRLCGISGDDFDQLYGMCEAALADADVLLLSGGTSVGQRDFTRAAFERLDNTSVLVHGVAIRPGKPTILARQGGKALFGLPGHVASASVTFLLFVRPMLRRMAGLPADSGLRVQRAVTSQPIPSAIGREDYVSVELVSQEGSAVPLARPAYGKSGLLSPLVRACGLLPVGRDVEGLDRGVETDVLLFPER